MVFEAYLISAPRFYCQNSVELIRPPDENFITSVAFGPLTRILQLAVVKQLQYFTDEDSSHQFLQLTTTNLHQVKKKGRIYCFTI